MENDIVIVEKVFKASLKTVWKALTDKDEIHKWYFNVDDFKPEKGFEFSFAGQGRKGEEYIHLCKVTEVLPLKEIQYSWQYKNYPGNSLVTFDLFEEGDDTQLKLAHTGIKSFAPNGNDFSLDSFTAGWNEIINNSLANYLSGK